MQNESQLLFYRENKVSARIRKQGHIFNVLEISQVGLVMVFLIYSRVESIVYFLKPKALPRIGAYSIAQTNHYHQPLLLFSENHPQSSPNR